MVVLLKHGIMEAVECHRDDVFLLARLRNAGICGVFESPAEAEQFIERHRLPLRDEEAGRGIGVS